MKHVETLKALKVAKSPNQKQKLQQETKLIGLLVNVNHMEKRKKKKPKAGNREKNKSCGRKKKRKKKMDFNVNVSNVSVKVRVISFNERSQLSKFYWWSMKWSTIDNTEDLDSNSHVLTIFLQIIIIAFLS